MREPDHGAMPQMGQTPWPTCRICRCIGQVKITPSAGGGGEDFGPGACPCWWAFAEQQPVCLSAELAWAMIDNLGIAAPNFS